MRGRNFRLVGDGGRQMALQADGVHSRLSQQLWIAAAVWHMACDTARLLHGFVFVNPRAGFVGVAL